MGSGTGALRGLFVAIRFLGFIWFLLVGILGNQAAQSTMIVTVPSSRNFKMEKLIERERLIAGHRDSDFNYVSKRRVPNGPDPIHNRRARKAREPPGRA